VCPNLIMVR